MCIAGSSSQPAHSTNATSWTPHRTITVLKKQRSNAFLKRMSHPKESLTVCQITVSKKSLQAVFSAFWSAPRLRVWPDKPQQPFVLQSTCSRPPVLTSVSEDTASTPTLPILLNNPAFCYPIPLPCNVLAQKSFLLRRALIRTHRNPQETYSSVSITTA